MGIAWLNEVVLMPFINSHIWQRLVYDNTWNDAD